MFLRSILFVLAAVAVLATMNVIQTSNYFRKLEPNTPHQCARVKDAGGEDIALLPGGRFAITSHGEFRDMVLNNEYLPGRLVEVDLDAVRSAFDNEENSGSSLSAGTKELHIENWPANTPIPVFHGVDILTHNEKHVLFVVAHARTGNSVITFDYTPSTNTSEPSLVYRRTFKNDELLPSPNDVVGVTQDSFYVTNDHAIPFLANIRDSFGPTGVELMKTLVDVIGIRTAFLSYFDGSPVNADGNDNGIVAKSNLFYPNGIEISFDQKHVFVGLTLGQAVVKFSRNEDNTLKEVKSFPYKGGLDNLVFDDAENLWVGSHIYLLQFLEHAHNPSAHSPSEAIRLPKTQLFSEIATGPKEIPPTQSFYTNDGTLNDFSGVATAAYSIRTHMLLLGSVFDEDLLVCNFGSGIQLFAES